MSPTTALRFPALLGLVACLVVAPVAGVSGVGFAGGSGLDDITSADTSRAGGVGVDGQPGIVTADNTSNYLDPDPGSRNRRSIQTVDIDVSSAVSMSADQLRGRHERLTIDQKIRNAETRSRQVAVIRGEFDRIERDIEALSDRRREALAAYSNGSLSTPALTARLARVDNRADQIEHRLERLRSAINDVGAGELSNRVHAIRGQFVDLTGTVSHRLRRALTGQNPDMVTYVSVSGSNGVVLSTVTEEWVYRQTFDGRAVGTDGPDQFNLDGEEDRVPAAYERFQELYPWTSANSFTTPRSGFADTAIYQASFTLANGNATMYLDGRTTDVFYEVQQRRVDSVPVTDTVRATNGTLSLTANATAGSWPLIVSTNRTDTNTGASTTVRIDGEPVGETGPDGRLVTLQPAGPFTVNATTTSGESVEVTVGS